MKKGFRKVLTIKNLILGILVLLVGNVMGLVTHLHYYPQEAFSNFYKKVVKEGSEGRWIHRRHLNDHTFTEFPRPNNDTLYSYCMLDLDKGPVVIEIPAIDRYWTVQFIKDNTDTFHYLRSRIQGLNKPAKALLALRGYAGESHGLEVIYSPTSRVWLFARLLVAGQEDIPLVNRLQDQFKCIPLNQYRSL